MAAPLADRSSQRDALLHQMRGYHDIQNRITVPLAGVKALLSQIEAFLNGEPGLDENTLALKDDRDPKSDTIDDDIESKSEFDDVNEEDLRLAERVKPDDASAITKRISSSGMDDEPPQKKTKMSDDGACVRIAESILQNIWGFPKFRLKQEQAISRLISGGSAVVVFPTGGGKSLVYQIPALAFNEYDQYCQQDPGHGLTLVVSPLIALMKVRAVE